MEKDIREDRNITQLEELVKSYATSLADVRDQLNQAVAERKHVEAELRKYKNRLEKQVQEGFAGSQESEGRYRTLFDNVPIGLYRSTPGGQLVEVNQALVEMLGYEKREEILKINTSSLYIDPEERDGWKTFMEQEGVVRDYEVRHRRHDGKIIWVKDTARAIKDEFDKVKYYEGSLEDITEQKLAEAEVRKYREHLEELVEDRTAELRQSEERYRTLFDGVPVGLYRSRPTGQFLDVNQAFIQMAGFPDRETLLSINTSALYVDPEEQVQWKALMEKEGVVRDFETQGRQYDGTTFWFSESARAIKDEAGQVIYYEGSITNITERKRFEEELRRQMEYFEALFIHIPVAALTADLEANVVSWNPMAEKLFGYSEEEALGRQVDDLVAKHPRIHREALDYTKQVFSDGIIKAVTKRTRKDGTLVDVELRSLSVIVGGKMVGYIAIYHDISELQSARRTAEAANQAKSAFLANMSHELRTPLNAILGFTQLMDGDPNLTDEQKENLGIINRSGEHLLTLINDVLEMSKIEAGRVTLREKSFDLFHLLDTLQEMFRMRAEAKGLTLTVERTENLPQYILADEGKMSQVLMNLLGNAVKFTDEGGVALRAKLASDKKHLIFEVEDTGPGIGLEDLDLVFDPFTQSMIGQRSIEGTGLGLSISRKFARLMGGDITVRSVLGHGSIFRFEVLPGKVDSEVIEGPSPTLQVLGLQPGQATYRLLVVDDRETTRKLLVKLLRPLGFEICEAVDGQEAIEIWENWKPHLIWMDMRMPVLDGYEATRQIKSKSNGQDTVIVALTASAFEEDRETILSAGCDDLVRKPFRKEEIYNQLTKHLGVQFIYSAEQVVPKTASSARLQDILKHTSLAALPAGWLNELEKATIKAQLNHILILTDQIRDQNEPLADIIANMARDFEYRTIQSIIDQIGGQK